MRHSAGFGQILEDTLALLISLALAFEMSRRLFRWEPEEKIPGRAKLWAAATLIPFLLLGTWQLTRGHLLREINRDFQMMSQGSVSSRPVAAPLASKPK